MSLTSFIKNPDVRKKFKEEFHHIPVPRKHNAVVAPLTNHYGLVGTAFDYLLRFYLKRLNPRARSKPWIAEYVPAIFERRINTIRASRDEMGKSYEKLIANYRRRYGSGQMFERRIKTFQMRRNELVKYYSSLLARNRRHYSKAQDILTNAKRIYSEYLNLGRIDKRLLRTVILLAQLDPFYRSGQDEYRLGRVSKRDIKDLRALITLVNARLFKARKVASLNPTFGRASRLMGGADADVLIDDTIIEVKTTKELKVRRDSFNQLIGYYILAKMGGIDGISRKHQINRIGFYFSRFGELCTFNIDDMIQKKGLHPFIRWFRKRARAERTAAFV